MQPLVSVIVPVYKTEKFLERCVESILAQTLKNIEVILVDDGSPDICPQICDRFAMEDSRVKVIHKKNGGLSDARNTGIAAAKGEYIGFVDSDDYIAPTMYEELYKAINESGVKLALCSFTCIDEQGILTDENHINPVKNETLTAEQLLPKLYETGGWFYIVAWNKLYHRSLLTTDFFPFGKIHEDEFVIAQTVYNAGKIACINKKMYYYIREREGSITNNQADIRHLDYLEAMILRYYYYQQVGMNSLLHDTRAILFRELEKFVLEVNENNLIVKERVNNIKQAYGCFNGLSLLEKIKWKLFCISPKMEKNYRYKKNIRNEE